MIKLLTNRLNLFFLSTASNSKVINGKVVADLPWINFPTKPKPEEDQRLPMSVAYQTMNYVRKDKLPNCRYFAMEHKNRIYRFYNAYYYPLGRMINRVASEIRGRTSPHYKNHVANVKNGDICVIVNIEDPLVTGKKLLYKKLKYHTGFIGHLKEYTYKHVLNHKPELLYHYLLRRTMPKNKLSQKYFENVMLVRGPTHNLKHFPQFAPDRKQYSLLPKVNLLDMLKSDQNLKVIEQSQPGDAENIFNKKLEKHYTDLQLQQIRRESDEVIEDLSKPHEDIPQYKQVPDISQRKFKAMKQKEKQIEDRYKPIRAPYRKKSNANKDNIKVYTSERKARKDPNYSILQDEDMQQVDDENKAEDPHIIGGGVQKKE